MAMRPGVVDCQQVAFADRGQAALNSKLVVIFAERDGDIVGLRLFLVGFTDHINVVIGVIHPRAHQR